MSIRTKVLVASYLFLLGVIAYAYFQPVQEDLYTEFSGSIDSTIVQSLAKDWDLYETDLDRTEQVYCIVKYRVEYADEWEPRVSVLEIRPGVVTEATPFSLSYSCGAFPAIHTHPPSDCEVFVDKTWSCKKGDPTSLESCRPSDIDVATVRETEWHRFGVVQCGRNRFVFFAPDP